MMGEVSSYCMDLYCDHIDHIDEYHPSPHAEISGSSRGDCLREARKYGWLINEKRSTREGVHGMGYTLCPRHSGKKPLVRGLSVGEEEAPKGADNKE